MEKHNITKTKKKRKLRVVKQQPQKSQDYFPASREKDYVKMI